MLCPSIGDRSARGPGELHPLKGRPARSTGSAGRQMEALSIDSLMYSLAVLGWSNRKAKSHSTGQDVDLLSGQFSDLV